MFIFLPLAAALLQASSLLLDKTILSIRRMNFGLYTGAGFPLYFLMVGLFFLVIRPPLDIIYFSGNLGLLLILSIALAAGTNFVFYRALESDHLGELESLGLLQSIPTILFSSFIFPDERHYALIIPALIASSAVVWAHWKKHHFAMARATIPFLVWILVAAPVGAATMKTLLATWNPISLEFFRSGALALIFAYLFFRKPRLIPSRVIPPLLLTNFLSASAWILFYISYQRLGIVHTLLLFSLQPLLVYFGSLFFLKEALEWKKTVAFVIVIAAIGAAQALSRLS